jgi:hypothetical protein
VNDYASEGISTGGCLNVLPLASGRPASVNSIAKLLVKVSWELASLLNADVLGVENSRALDAISSAKNRSSKMSCYSDFSNNCS